MVNNEKIIRYLMLSLGISAVVICLIGLSQLMEHDIFRTKFGLGLIIPGEYRELVKSIDFKFDQIYATFMNPNYVGSYMAMIALLALSYLIFIKGIWHKLFASVILILSLVNLFGSRSRGGLLGLAVGILLLLIISRKQVFKNKIVVAGAIVGIIAVFGVVNSFTDGLLSNRLKSMVQFSKQDNTDFLKISPVDDKLLISCDGDRSYMYYNANNEVIIEDMDLNVRELTVDNDVYRLANQVHENLSITIARYKDLPVIELKYKNLVVPVVPVGDEYRIVNPANELINITNSESWGFEGYEKIGSSRGYIWSRTIPLLKDNILYGQGPDTYALAFPQNDICAKAIAFSDPWIIVDKPHNMYLQIGVNTGVISLIAFLALYLIYFIQSIPLYFKGKLDSFLKISGVAFLLATLAYMVTGLFNDSVVSVAPVFWILLGSGIGINLKNKAENEAPQPVEVKVSATGNGRKAKKAGKKGKR